jgi:hypothetical protein
MSFPYALLHFEAQQAKQRLTQVFHAGPGLRSDSLYQPLKVGKVFLDGWTSIEHAPGRIDRIPVWRPERSHRFSVLLQRGRRNIV